MLIFGLSITFIAGIDSSPQIWRGLLRKHAELCEIPMVSIGTPLGLP
jgi:hypothetical protein